MRGRAALLAAAALLGLIVTQSGHAHAGLVSTEPTVSANLGASPTVVRLTFSEQPEPSLSTVRVLDGTGAERQLGRPFATAADARSLLVRIPDLGRGVYTVSWRAVSEVDGHATTGVFAFGIRASPNQAAVSSVESADSSSLELTARWLFIGGIVILLGAAAASAGRFGGDLDAALAAVGWIVAVVGLIALTLAQHRASGVSFGELLDTSIGRSLAWRAGSLAAAGALLLAARSPANRAWAMLGVGIAGAVAVAVHVAAGHAAAVNGARFANELAQWGHFTAVGVWVGGLAALLLGVRGRPSESKAIRVRRFSTVALAGFIVVAATGIVRAVWALSSWNELVSTGYGRAVLAKLGLLAFVAVLGARNRLGSIPLASTDLRPLRRTSAVELGAATTAVFVAALLGTLAPPAAGRKAPAGLELSASDYGTTTRVRLATASAEPGPNEFVLNAADYDTGDPIEADQVRLRFTPLDDPDVASTTLALTETKPGTYAGSGSNLAFDGRWRVTAAIQRRGGSVSVPFELEALSPPRLASVVRRPGEPPSYTVELGREGFIRVSPDPERAGRSRLSVSFFDLFQNRRTVDDVAVTAAAGDAPAHRLAARKVSANRFVADVVLVAGNNTIAVVERPPGGSRVRATFDLDVPGE